mmetsp:Transcript_2502/g.3441  ORF Transcript_2502/g.3441 Transcript_2502/m.3441 type:complete len:142 (+) Transcript_2502:6-431(+)
MEKKNDMGSLRIGSVSVEETQKTSDIIEDAKFNWLKSSLCVEHANQSFGKLETSKPEINKVSDMTKEETKFSLKRPTHKSLFPFSPQRHSAVGRKAFHSSAFCLSHAILERSEALHHRVQPSRALSGSFKVVAHRNRCTIQ